MTISYKIILNGYILLLVSLLQYSMLTFKLSYIIWILLRNRLGLNLIVNQILLFLLSVVPYGVLFSYPPIFGIIL